MKVSIIIPVLNEEATIREKLLSLQWARDAGHEIIVVDGGSTDNTVQSVGGCANSILTSKRGRATQMNTGADSANNEVLLFLHIDTDLPREALISLTSSLENTNHSWGRFNVRLSGKQFMFRIIETMMNWRSRVSGIATGDQAIFVRKGLFERIGGYADIALMEDVEICKRLRIISKPACLTDKVITSSRRWEMLGIFSTILLMWRLRFSYWLGADPDHLARQYYQ